MRRSPFYAYPSYPFQHPHSFFAPSADNAFLHRPPHTPFPSSSPSVSGSARTSRPVINVPVHDSGEPSPPPRPPATRPAHATSPPPLLDPTYAATTIQSHFRGFSIRRHRPLLHLRSIAGARKQLEELKLELDTPGFATKVRASDKERLRFCESVMAVILRLDAIEGPIPEVRSLRKEATKMAIKLQDAIDDIMMQQDESSDPKPGDGAPSDAGAVEVDDPLDCKQTEESLCCDIDMVQEVMPIMLGGGQTSAADAHRMQEAAPTFLDEGPTSPEGDMAGEFSATTAMMDLDNNDVMKMVDEGVPRIPFLKAEDAGPEIVDSGHIVYKSGRSESGSQDVSAQAMDAADHDMCYTHEKVAGSDPTCVVEADVNSGCDSGCAEANSVIMQAATLVTKECEDIRVDDCIGSNCDLGKDVVADQSDAFMDIGREDEEGVRRPGPPIAEGKLDLPHDSGNATEVILGQLCCASPPREHLEDQHQGATALEDTLVEELAEWNCSFQCADAPTSSRHENENLKDEGKHLPSTDSTVKTSFSSDSRLLQQLSEDCRQLKSLLGKVLAHSKAQSKIICALGDRLETLEHQQQLNRQNSLRKTYEKQKPKKGSKRNDKLLKR